MNNQTILLIDYDPASISKTATPLTKAGYHVEVAKDGLSGLAAFERMKPAIVLVEAMLPRKHGFEVCQEIKAKPEGKSTPVLITTAVCRGRKYRMDALQIYGCDEYIEKPITDEELLKMIHRFVQQANEARERVAEDLSEAIDEVSSREGSAADVPVAIETMGDEELEAQIDALLEGGAPVTEGDGIRAPHPVPEAPAAVATPVEAPAAESAPIEEVEEEDVTDRQLDALFQSVPSAIEPPAEQPETLPVEAEPAHEPPAAAPVQDTLEPETPILDTDTDWFAPQPEAETEAGPAVETTSPEPAVAPTADDEALPAAREWTETAEPAKGGRSKLALVGVVVVVVLGAAGFLAFQQGWIGGAQAVEPVAGNAPNPTPRASTSRAQAFTPPIGAADETLVGPPALETELAEQFEPEPVAPAEAQPRPSAPKPELPPKPQAFEGRSESEVEAARKRQRQADRDLSRAAVSLESQLLATDAAAPPTVANETVAPVDVVDEIPLGEPVRPKAQRGQLYLLSEVDESPVHIRFDQPEYDEIARRMNQEGVVLVEVLIDETGQVAETRLVQSIPNSRLNDATLRAARRWIYEPAVKDGVPVMVWKPERILFELE